MIGFKLMTILIIDSYSRNPAISNDLKIEFTWIYPYVFSNLPSVCFR